MANFSIGAVARRTGLAADTIRMWERRYALVRPLRGPGGIRSYGEPEVSRLLLARQATELGHAIRNVAALDDAAIAALIETKPQPAPRKSDGASDETVVAVLLDALLNDDPARLKRMIISAATLMEPRDLILRILVPLFAHLGALWARGDLSIWQEHFLSELVGTTVRSVGNVANNGDAEKGIVFATPPQELHAFGTAFAATIASSRGLRAYNLGVSVPVAELATAAKRLRVQYVAIGITGTEHRSVELAAFFEELDRRLPRSIAVWVGGHASAEIIELAGASRFRAVGTLEEFDAALERQR